MYMKTERLNLMNTCHANVTVYTIRILNMEIADYSSAERIHHQLTMGA